MSNVVTIAMTILALALIVSGFWFYQNRYSVSQGISQWKTYRDEVYNFEIKYPPEWTPRLYQGSLAEFQDMRAGDWKQEPEKTIRVGFGVIDFIEKKNTWKDSSGIEITSCRHGL